MRHVVTNRRGSAVLMAVMGLMMVGGMGATTIAIVSSDQAGRTASLASDQAYGLAQAGIEYAKNRIDAGHSPTVQNFAMGAGTFTVAASPSTGGLTSTGQVGNAQKTFNLTTQYGKDCIDLDVSTAQVSAKQIVGAKLTKSCLSQATITDWTIAWTPDNQEGTTKLQVQGQQLMTLYDYAPGYSSGTLINAVDLTLSSNNAPTPINKIEFANTLPAGKTYTITIHLADGSAIAKSFLDPVRGPSPPPDNGGGDDGAQADATPGYDVDEDGDVSVEPNRTVGVQALCSEITYGRNGPNIPVRASLGVNGSYSALFGGSAIDGGETYTAQSGESGQDYTLQAEAHYVSRGRTRFRSQYDSNDTRQVRTLVNGDRAPPLAGFGGQKPVSECIQNYINGQNGIVQLQPNQVLLLFELGVNMARNPTSTAADFQDLVVLMTVD
jgi:hypothetical protein